MKFTHFVAAAALLAGSGTAGAQLTFHDEPAARMEKKVQLDEDRARRMMNDFARCVAKKRKGHAEALLALPYGSLEQAEAGRQIVIGQEDCVPRVMSGYAQLSFQPDALIGGMAEELVRTRLRKTKGGESLLASQQAAVAGLTPRNGAEEFGYCVVSQDLAATHAFVSAKVASDEEDEAARALVPSLANCVLEGQTLSLKKAALRILLSVSLYHALTAPPAPLG